MVNTITKQRRLLKLDSHFEKKTKTALGLVETALRLLRYVSFFLVERAKSCFKLKALARTPLNAFKQILICRNIKLALTRAALGWERLSSELQIISQNSKQSFV